MTCQCTSCLIILKREPSDNLRSMLVKGAVKHVGTTSAGKPIYREW
jgi:hypothetical protein